MMEIHKRIGERYECKMSMIGGRKHLAKELSILNRKIRWTDAGIEIDADKRHAEEIIKEARLTDHKKSPTPVSTEYDKESSDC